MGEFVSYQAWVHASARETIARRPPFLLVAIFHMIRFVKSALACTRL